MTDDKDRATDLLIQEVNEDLQREHYARLWKRYGNWVIGAAVAVVAFVAGHQLWQNYQVTLRQDEAGRYAAALELAEAGRGKEAAEAMAVLAGQSQTGYDVVASLTRARLLAESGDEAGAIAVYDAIAADGSADRIYRDLATIQAAYLAVDSADPVQLQARIDPLVSGGPWRHSALELSALIARRRGDVVMMREVYQKLADDANTPPGMRQRAAEMLAAIGPQDAAPADAQKG